MEEVIAMSRLNADAKGLELRVELAEDVPVALVADALRLRQILLNLVINGVKYTDSGSVILRVRHEAASQAAMDEDTQHSGLLVLQVCDTGRGIPESMRQRLFTPRQVSDVHRGAGLGLAISHELALLMHGRLLVESTPGEGSTFELRVPVLACSLPVQPLENRPLSRPPVPARILLVDDIAYIRQHLRNLLEPQGFRVDEADCGAAAVHLCDLHNFDLILMDIDLPDFDGVQVTRLIREGTSLNKSTPVVAVTGHAASARRADFLNAGMKDCVPKPISRVALLAAVNKWVRLPAAWATPGLGGHQS
jgi:CheY-like chemotaxis protein